MLKRAECPYLAGAQEGRIGGMESWTPLDHRRSDDLCPVGVLATRQPVQQDFTFAGLEWAMIWCL